MDTFNGHHDGDLTLADDLLLNGMVSGTVTVPFRRKIVLNGLVTGDVIVVPFASAAIHGTVSGTVHNRGGDVEVFGVVGAIADTGPTKTVIDSNAVVGARPLNRDLTAS